MAQFLIDKSSVTVTNDGSFHDPDEGFPRVQYMCVITTPDWEYVCNDVHGPSGGYADVNKAGQSILAWLHDIGDLFGKSQDWGDDWPEHVARWAAGNVMELGIQSNILADLNEEAPVDEDSHDVVGDEPDQDESEDDPF